jgi:hypothetical protein
MLWVRQGAYPRVEHPFAKNPQITAVKSFMVQAPGKKIVNVGGLVC